MANTRDWRRTCLDSRRRERFLCLNQLAVLELATVPFFESTVASAKTSYNVRFLNENSYWFCLIH